MTYTQSIKSNSSRARLIFQNDSAKGGRLIPPMSSSPHSCLSALTHSYPPLYYPPIRPQILLHYAMSNGDRWACRATQISALIRVQNAHKPLFTSKSTPENYLRGLAKRIFRVPLVPYDKGMFRRTLTSITYGFPGH